jgi:hypothetical protein
VRAYADCIASTFSMNNVLPNGTYVEFDSDAYLAGSYTHQMSDMEMPTDVVSQS